MTFTLFVILYGVGVLLSTGLITGWYVAEDAGRWPHGFNYRHALGRNLVVGFFSGLLWPIALPTIFCVTGFAQYGWRISRPAPSSMFTAHPHE